MRLNTMPTPKARADRDYGDGYTDAAGEFVFCGHPGCYAEALWYLDRDHGVPRCRAHGRGLPGGFATYAEFMRTFRTQLRDLGGEVTNEAAADWCRIRAQRGHPGVLLVGLGPDGRLRRFSNAHVAAKETRVPLNSVYAAVNRNDLTRGWRFARAGSVRAREWEKASVKA